MNLNERVKRVLQPEGPQGVLRSFILLIAFIVVLVSFSISFSGLFTQKAKEINFVSFNEQIQNLDDYIQKNYNIDISTIEGLEKNLEQIVLLNENNINEFSQFFQNYLNQVSQVSNLHQQLSQYSSELNNLKSVYESCVNKLKVKYESQFDQLHNSQQNEELNHLVDSIKKLRSEIQNIQAKRMNAESEQNRAEEKLRILEKGIGDKNEQDITIKINQLRADILDLEQQLQEIELDYQQNLYHISKLTLEELKQSDAKNYEKITQQQYENNKNLLIQKKNQKEQEKTQLLGELDYIQIHKNNKVQEEQTQAQIVVEQKSKDISELKTQYFTKTQELSEKNRQYQELLDKFNTASSQAKEIQKNLNDEMELCYNISDQAKKTYQLYQQNKDKYEILSQQIQKDHKSVDHYKQLLNELSKQLEYYIQNQKTIEVNQSIKIDSAIKTDI